MRERIRRELAERGVLFAGRGAWHDVRLGAFATPEYLPWEGRTLGELIDDRGDDPVDVLCDVLLDEDLRPNQVTPGPWSESLPEFIRHPVGMIGTDSTFVAERPSPRTYGSFPRVLGQFVRDEALISLEEAVRSMTSAPAARLGSARPRPDSVTASRPTSSSSIPTACVPMPRTTSRGASPTGSTGWW